MGESQDRGGRSSLRTRLPVYFAVPVVLVLASFLFVTDRQIESALVEARHGRAHDAASELALRLSEGLTAALASMSNTAADPAIRAVLTNPTPATREAAERLLALPARDPERTELWDTAGTLALEVVNVPEDTGRGPPFPRGEPPAATGASPFRTQNGTVYFDVTVPVRADSTASAPIIGYFRRFDRLRAEPAGLIRGLVGEQAVVALGSEEPPAWSDFGGSIAPPPAPVPDEEGVYQADDGGLWVGSFVPVDGTPWLVWIGFPREVVVAPAAAFMRTMVLLSLVLVALGIGLVALLAVRLTRPVVALAAVADRIADGDFSQRVEPIGSDEIGRLGHVFNTMVARIEASHRALSDAHRKTRFALDAAGAATWEMHLPSRTLTCSESMARLHPGLEHETHVGPDAFLAGVDPDYLETMRRVLAGQVGSSGIFDVQYRLVAPDGRARWIEAKGQVTRADDGSLVSVQGVSIDMTQRRRLEAQLGQSAKMEAIGQLAGGVAHDFNNLLTAIVGHASLIMSELPEDSTLRDDITDILKAGESASALTRQLLTFSRGQKGEVKLVDLNALIGETERLLRRLISENIDIETRLGSDLAAIRADPGRIEQILVNLAVNARDAMPNGGRLRIATSNVHVDDSSLSGDTSARAGWQVLLAVTDTGIGMDAETQAHIFEPFFSTKPAEMGTGLGLATVFGIVKQIGGHIFVYSEPGRGTTFKIYFPAVTDTPRPEHDVSPEVLDARGGSERILLVEDDAAVRDVAKTILQRFHYHVETATDGDDALRILADMHEPPALVITDVIMPGMTGPELRERIHAIHPDVRMLFSSGYSGETLASYGVSGNNVMFIEKPYSPIALARKVREALDRGR